MPGDKPAPGVKPANDRVSVASARHHSYAASGPEGNSLTPEKYYQLLLERQRLEISSDKQILVILDAHANDPFKARADLQKHEEERAAKNEALFKKYDISADDYYRSSRGTREQTERAKYLNKHSDVRDQIVANSKELRALEKQVWRRLMPSWPAPSHKATRKNSLQRGP